MTLTFRHQPLLALLLGLLVMPNVRATGPDPADQSVEQFLAQSNDLHQYRAIRRLEAENGSRHGWLEAVTEYSPDAGFEYEITAEGGSEYIRDKVLRAVLDGERDVIVQGEAARSALARSNYVFQADGVGADGLAKVLLSPKRKERMLLSGTMFLKPGDGELVRLQGRLARNPSFWVKNVDIVRTYERIGVAIVPTSLESRAELRLLGGATLRMTYKYLEVDGRPIKAVGQ
jgi:hypothetical protein